MSERGAPGTWQWFCYWHPQGGLDLERTLAEMPSDDLTASLLILAELDGRLHWLVQAETWLLWDGRCHRPDRGDAVTRMIAAWAAGYHTAIGQCQAADRAEFLRGHDQDNQARAAADADRHVSRWEGKLKFAASLRRNGPMRSMKAYLASMAGCPDADFNERWPEYLNCANGVVHLRTGVLHPHDPRWRMTYCLDVAYNPDAACPLFGSLVRSACGGSDEVPRYLMDLLGYSLLGHNRQQKIVFISGPSASGKSKLLSVISRVLGPVAHESQADLITVVRHGRNARTENSIRGMRLITITETSQFMTIDEGQLKRLTGEDRISVNEHYNRTEIETPVTWLIIVATNSMPNLTNFDTAMRRRIIVIPGGETIPDWLQDPDLDSKILESEAEGVLAALVRACVRGYSTGIRSMPAEVSVATDIYADEQNTVANFLGDLCEPGGPDDRIAQKELYDGYLGWSKGSGRLGSITFYEHLERAGYYRNKDQRYFAGLRWKSDAAVRSFTQWHAGNE